jgi:hypothetical protein
VPPPTLAAARLDDRQKVIGGNRSLSRKRRKPPSIPRANAVGTFRERAFDLMTSPAAKKAFDIHSEDEKLRDAYGRNTLGQSCLMARSFGRGGCEQLLLIIAIRTHTTRISPRSNDNYSPGWIAV